MSPDGMKLLDDGISIFKSETQPTVEGPKLMKRDGYYYIIAPAGGVPTGWQAVLRAKNIYGPYEEKVVLHQGETAVNGPHQGGLVDAPDGSWWFVHFQDKGAYGRIVHLQPAHWKDGWPLMGIDVNDDGIGEPVSDFNKPVKSSTSLIPQCSDEFEGAQLGLQWQWQANPQEGWYSLTENKGAIRLCAVSNPTQNGNFYFVPNLLLQKFPAPTFTATTKISFHPEKIGDKAGLVVMGKKWSYLSVEKTESGLKIAHYIGAYQQCGDLTEETESEAGITGNVFFRVFVNNNGVCQFSFSNDGEIYTTIGKEFNAEAGVWIGAKVGVFCITPSLVSSVGYADFEWFHVE